jgi:hypothetical protein
VLSRCDRITDLDVLRRMVLQRETLLLKEITEIADREAQWVEGHTLVIEQRKANAERDVAIAQRDHEIHFKSAKIEAVSGRLKFDACSVKPCDGVKSPTRLHEEPENRHPAEETLYRLRQFATAARRIQYSERSDSGAAGSPR